MEKVPRTKAQRAIQQERRLAKLRTVIADWKSSGMSAQEYGDSVGIPKTRLNFWSQELRKKEAAAPVPRDEHAVAKNVMNGERRSFLPLIATKEQPQVNVQGSLTIEVFLRGDRRVAVSGLNLDQITPLLISLEGVDQC